MPRKESRHAIRSECLSDQPVVQTGQPRLHLSENIWKPDAASRLPVSNLCFRRNSEFNSDYQRIGLARAEARGWLAEPKLRDAQPAFALSRYGAAASAAAQRRLVEPIGIEPTDRK